MKELAELLKSERLKRGVSLEEMYRRVRVTVPMLRALEEGRMERIGAPVLIRSFIRAYCSALDMDPESLLREFDADIRRCDVQGEGILRYKRWLKTVRSPKRRRFGWVVVIFLTFGTVYGSIWITERQERLRNLEFSRGLYFSQDLPPDLIQGEMRATQANPDRNALPKPLNGNFEKKSPPSEVPASALAQTTTPKPAEAPAEAVSTPLSQQPPPPVAPRPRGVA